MEWEQYERFITEKPSVAMELAKVLGVKGQRKDGYIEDDKYIVTWCIKHLNAMLYPDKYDEALKKCRLDYLPFLPAPDTNKYEVIPATK